MSVFADDPQQSVATRGSENSETESLYKRDEKIKAHHAERRAKKTGKQEQVSSLLSPTVSSLTKRQSFRRPSHLTRRTQSLDSVDAKERNEDGSEENGFEAVRRTRTSVPDEELERIAESSDEENDEEDEEEIHDHECPLIEQSSTPRLQTDLDASSVQNRRPASIQTLVRSGQFIQHGTLPDEAPSERTEGRRNCLEGATSVTEEMEGGCSSISQPKKLRWEGEVDVLLTDEELRSTNDMIDHQRAPLEHSYSLDSTGAMTSSPSRMNAITSATGAGARRATNAHLSSADKRSVSNNERISKEQARGSSSNSMWSSGEIRLQPKVTSGRSPPPAAYLQQIVQPSRQRRREQHTVEKPQIMRSLLLAGAFTGAAVIIGSVFSDRSQTSS